MKTRLKALINTAHEKAIKVIDAIDEDKLEEVSTKLEKSIIEATAVITDIVKKVEEEFDVK